MTSYRVVDCRPDLAEPREVIIDKATSPEDAAFKAIGETLVRSGRPADLRVRVYFQHAGQVMSMVRLYAKAIDRSVLNRSAAGSEKATETSGFLRATCASAGGPIASPAED